MKTLTKVMLIGASALSLAAGAASAQPMRPHHGISINARQAELDHRIDNGVRSGELTRREAHRLRREFHAIAQREARYRLHGLSRWERADLERRFDRLAAEIHLQKHDNQYGYGYGHDRVYRR
jgi:hypothetical protein